MITSVLVRSASLLFLLILLLTCSSAGSGANEQSADRLAILDDIHTYDSGIRKFLPEEIPEVRISWIKLNWDKTSSHDSEIAYAPVLVDGSRIFSIAGYCKNSFIESDSRCQITRTWVERVFDDHGYAIIVDGYSGGQFRRSQTSLLLRYRAAETGQEIQVSAREHTYPIDVRVLAPPWNSLEEVKAAIDQIRNTLSRKVMDVVRQHGELEIYSAGFQRGMLHLNARAGQCWLHFQANVNDETYALDPSSVEVINSCEVGLYPLGDDVVFFGNSTPRRPLWPPYDTVAKSQFSGFSISDLTSLIAQADDQWPELKEASLSRVFAEQRGHGTSGKIVRLGFEMSGARDDCGGEALVTGHKASGDSDWSISEIDYTAHCK